MATKLILAGCVILNDKNQLILMHRNTPKRVQWETPGGKIEEGEKPEQAAERELKEELGVDIQMEEKFDNLKYFSWEGLEQIQNELSPNTKNFLVEYSAGRIDLND